MILILPLVRQEYTQGQIITEAEIHVTPCLLRTQPTEIFKQLCPVRQKHNISWTERSHASIKPGKKDGNGLRRKKNIAGWCWVQVHYDWHWKCRFGMQWVCELGDSSTCLCEIQFSTKLGTDNFLWGFDVSFRTHDAAWSRAFDFLSKCWRNKASLPFQSLWCAAKSLLHHPTSISRLPKAVASQHGLSPKPPNHLAILGIAQAGVG